MPYPTPPRLALPLAACGEPGRHFQEEGVLGGRSWGLHLGVDLYADPGTPVSVCGDGQVVYAALHPGSRRRGNWGNVILLGHTHAADGKPFFSVYGHLGALGVVAGQIVGAGAVLGPVGRGRTTENGYWPEPHLHFAIYRGPWEGRVLPGYFREADGRTKLEYWTDPEEFVRTYPGPGTR